MFASSSSRRSAAKSNLGRLSLGLVLAVGVATGSGPDAAEAKSGGAKAHGKRVAATQVAAPAAGRKASGGKVRTKARAAGRKIG